MTEPLFDPDVTSPVSLPTVDPANPAGWRYEPRRLRALADALRPLLRAGVDPLGAATAVLDVDTATGLSDAEETAQWLAEQSEHVRYAGEGWRMLLSSEGNVTHAHAEAVRKLAAPTAEAVQSLQGAKAFLVRWHAQHPPVDG